MEDAATLVEAEAAAAEEEYMVAQDGLDQDVVAFDANAYTPM